MMKREFAKAIPDLTKVIDNPKPNADQIVDLINRGFCYSKNGNYQLAINDA